MRVPEEPAVTIIVLDGAVRELFAVVKIADPNLGVEAYCAEVDIVAP
jgi:hypothetical protein